MLHHLVNLLFPKVCAGCKSILLAEEQCICTNCRHEIPTTDHLLIQNNEIHQLFYGRVDLQFAASLLYFQKHSLVQELIFSLKYKGNQQIGTILGFWMGEKMKISIKNQGFDFIIPVPLHPRKFKKRGYNQITTFSNAMSESMAVPMEENLLKRVQYSASQTKKSFLKRTQLDQNVFDVTFDQSFHNKHFLLIDDVLTTGSTVEQCAKALLKIPNAKISLLTISMSKLS